MRWTGLATAVNAAVNFLQTAVVAHFLMPAEFGISSMVVVVVAFAQMFADAGISAAIIHRQRPTRGELATLYWFNVLCGLVIFVIVNAAVPAIITFFGEPRLDGPLRLASLVFLITPLGQQFQFLLQKELRFRSLAIFSTSGYAGNLLVAVGLAAAGAGVYALVFGQIANATIRTILLLAARWEDRPSLHFARGELSGYLGFGLYQMGDKAANFFNVYLLHGLIGSMLGAHVLGIYTLAFELAFKPLDAITPVVTRVAFPVLAKIRDDIVRVRRGYLAMLRLLSTANFPLALGVAAMAPVIVPVVYGEAWRPVIPLVEVLAVVALLRSSGSPVGALLLGLGKANWGFWWSAGVTVLQLPGLYAGIALGDVRGAALAYLVLQVFFTAAAYRLLIRNLLGPCVGDYLKAFLPALGLAFVVAAVVRLAAPLFSALSLVNQLAALVLVSLCAFACSAVLFARELMMEILQAVWSRK